MASHGRAGRDIRATLTAAGLVAVVGAVVLGILGMHAFAHHDPTPVARADHDAATAAHDESTGPDVGARAGASSMATISRDVPAADSPASAPSSERATAEMPAPVHSMGAMVMLCAAMLLAVAAGILLAVRLRQHTPSTPMSTRPRPGNQTFPLAARIGIGPPAVGRFSVVRC